MIYSAILRGPRRPNAVSTASLLGIVARLVHGIHRLGAHVLLPTSLKAASLEDVASRRPTSKRVTEPMETSAQRSACPAPGTAGGVSVDSYAAGFHLRAALRDGTSVCVRAIRPDDKERLRTAFERLSPQSVYQRFFHPLTELTPNDLRRLTELDYRNHVGLVLTIEEETGERLFAVARFVRVARDADCAEVGFAVADEYQNRGAATLLLQQLIALARGSGVREFIAQLLWDNLRMLAVFQNSKLPLRQRLEKGIRHVVLSLDAGT